MKKWINFVSRKYAHFKLKKKNMLVLDEASVHKIHEIKKSLELSETKVMMIPGGLTRYLQPLDASINIHSKMESERSTMNIDWKREI